MLFDNIEDNFDPSNILKVGDKITIQNIYPRKRQNMPPVLDIKTTNGMKHTFNMVIIKQLLNKDFQEKLKMSLEIDPNDGIDVWVVEIPIINSNSKIEGLIFQSPE